MKIEKQAIELKQDGKTIKRAYLNRGYQRGYFYFEHDSITAELAQGKTKQQAEAGKLQRQALTLFNAAIETLNALYKLDAAAADALIAEIYSGFALANEARPGGGTNLKTLEQRAAAMFFAWQDANTILESRAGIEHAQLLTNLCFNVQEDHEHGRTEPNKRTREALRLFKETQTKAEKESRRELSPEGQAIYDALEAARAALDKCAEDGGPDEAETADSIMEKAEAPLDALALRDPEEATRIFNRSSYFDYESGDGDIYLGKSVFCRRDELMKLDTPEKRAAFVKYGTMPGEADNGTAEQPGPISGGAAPADGEPVIFTGCEGVTLDGGEPVTLDGCGEPAAIE